MDMAGLRYVPEEENQMRWENAVMLALSQLQHGMHLHPCGKEAEPSEGVRRSRDVWTSASKLILAQG